MSSVKKYSVIYYKRSNKVHKGRGITKFDGILIVTAPPECRVKLYKDENEFKHDCNESTCKQQNLVSSGINRDISMRAFGRQEEYTMIQEDESIVLPQFECEIVRCLSSLRNNSDSTFQQQEKSKLVAKSTSFVAKKRPHSTKNNTGMLKRLKPNTSKTVSTIKRTPLSSLKNKSSNQSTTKTPTRKIHQNHTIHATTTQIYNNDLTTNHFPGAIGKIVIPTAVQNILKPHQKEGISFLWNCLTGVSPSLNKVAQDMQKHNHDSNIINFNGAILADEMGLGKTLMTIATVFALFRKKKENRTIIVCPSSLVKNWEKEFDKWLGKASQPKRVAITKGGEEGIGLIKSFIKVKPTLTEVLIISYDLFRIHSAFLQNSQKIGLLVVDEGHRLKNSSGSQTLTALISLNCEARLLITGTVLQNNLTEFYNLVQFVNPGILGDLNFFRKTYERPIALASSKSATKEELKEGKYQAMALDQLTSTFMIRRFQKDILKSLLPERQEYLLFCRPTTIQCNKYLSLTKDIKMESFSKTGLSTEVLSLLMKLRKLCTHPKIAEDKSNYFNNLNETLASNHEQSGKLTILEACLNSIRKKYPHDKCVVVSNFTSALTIIEEILISNRHSFLRLDGSTKDRQSVVDLFNKSSVENSFVLLLSSKAGGCGLNLIGANRLIMFDPDWNPAIDLQAMARVYRQGQKKKCYIYRLFTSGTIEEIILQRQMQKGTLACMAVDSKSKMKHGEGFSEEELRDCFNLKIDCACDTKEKLGSKWRDYENFQSLKEQGCNDDVVLSVANSLSNALSFVHITKEDSSPEQSLDYSTFMGDDCINDYSSEEEFE